MSPGQLVNHSASKCLSQSRAFDPGCFLICLGWKVAFFILTTFKQFHIWRAMRLLYPLTFENLPVQSAPQSCIRSFQKQPDPARGGHGQPHHVTSGALDFLPHTFVASLADPPFGWVCAVPCIAGGLVSVRIQGEIFLNIICFCPASCIPSLRGFAR